MVNPTEGRGEVSAVQSTTIGLVAHHQHHLEIPSTFPIALTSSAEGRLSVVRMLSLTDWKMS